MKSFTSPDDLRRIQKSIEPYLPNSAIIWLWLKLNIDRPGGSGTSTESRCLVDRWPEPRVIAGLDTVDSYHRPRYPVLCLYSALDAVDESAVEVIERFVEDVSEVAGVRESGGIQPQAIDDRWIPAFRRVFVDRLGLTGAPVSIVPGKMYCLSDGEIERLRREEIRAPDGFQFGELSVEEDARFVNETWPHKHVGSLGLIERRIRHFPNVCLRESMSTTSAGDGRRRLASFELVHDQLGVMNHLYTVQEFRRRGLATLVELRLARAMLDEGYLPVKAVAEENEGGKKITEASSSSWRFVADVSWLRFGDERIAAAYAESDAQGEH